MAQASAIGQAGIQHMAGKHRGQLRGVGGPAVESPEDDAEQGRKRGDEPRGQQDDRFAPTCGPSLASGAQLDLQRAALTIARHERIATNGSRNAAASSQALKVGAQMPISGEKASPTPASVPLTPQLAIRAHGADERHPHQWADEQQQHPPGT